MVCVLFFKQKTAYERRISDWSSDVCSSDLRFEDYLRMVAESGAYGPGPVEQYVQGRMDFARRLEPQRFQRKQPDGTTLEIRRNPLPQGGFVTTYTDISDLKRREEALAASEERYAQIGRAHV